MTGSYYEYVEINNRGTQALSHGTQAFIAEFDRLINQCVAFANKNPGVAVRTAFDFLFSMLRKIDEATDDFLFFADDGGVLNIGVDWRHVFPSYFQCLAVSEAEDAYFSAAESVVDDFAWESREQYLSDAREIFAGQQSHRNR